MKKIIDILGDLRATLFLAFLHAFASGYATIVENDFGRATANVNVYYAWWFEAIQALLIINLIINLFRFRMLRLKKWTTLAIHVGIILIFIGGALSHFVGLHGSLHLREGEQKSEFPLKDMADRVIGSYKMPFSIKLTDFKLARYPGNNAPSSYESFIEIYENGKLVKPFHIYMNHILVYKGLRFYQASYDPDERGSILSVTVDPGKWPTYIGYFLLFVGLLANLFDPNSLFTRLGKQLKKIQEQKSMLGMVLLLGCLWPFVLPLQAQETLIEVDQFHADKVLAALPVQTFRGRIAPVDTIAQEVITKISKRDYFESYNYNQLLLAIFLAPDYWRTQPLIYVKHPELKERLGVGKQVKRVAYMRFFDDQGHYIFKEDADKAQKKDQARRGTFDRALISLNERLNAFYMASLGQFYKAFPDYNGDATKWAPIGDALSEQAPPEYNQLMKEYLFLVRNGDWHGADKRIKQIAKWQVKYSPELVPNHDKIHWELLFNHWKIFQKLPMLLFPFALFFLVIGFISTLSDRLKDDKLHPWALGVAVVAMAFYLFGLALRWYIAGRAPISDGYESMVFIGWATLLGGILFFVFRRSLLLLAVSMLFSALALGVAHLSWLDPQISSLVPVLKSYWLTIHVSVITASYGFLAISACLGFVNLLLLALRNPDNKRTTLTIKELNIFNHMSMIVGLGLLTIGTFLGGVWANESWGAYWSWDPKETWSWVSIVLYAMVIHTYYIPKLYSVYSFSVMSLFSIYSILMTYLGVNYYLAGLHSYAKGDPVPIPTWLYVMVAITIVVALSGYRKRKL